MSTYDWHWGWTSTSAWASHQEMCRLRKVGEVPKSRRFREKNNRRPWPVLNFLSLVCNASTLHTHTHAHEEWRRIPSPPSRPEMTVLLNDVQLISTWPMLTIWTLRFSVIERGLLLEARYRWTTECGLGHHWRKWKGTCFEALTEPHWPLQLTASSTWERPQYIWFTGMDDSSLFLSWLIVIFFWLRTFLKWYSLINQDNSVWVFFPPSLVFFPTALPRWTVESEFIIGISCNMNACCVD